MNQTMPPLRTRIKICGLTREQDVDTAAAAGVDAIGFNLYEKSPRYVTIDRAVELARRLPAFVTPVLLFVNASAGHVHACIDRLPHAVLQFHGDESPSYCWDASNHGAQAFIRAARISLDDTARDFDLVKYASLHSCASALLLDAHVTGYGGGGKTFNWSLLPPSVNCHLVLGGGLTPANVTDGIAQLRPRCKTLAVDVSSGVEVSPGIKDAGKMFQFVAAVRAADHQFTSLHYAPLPAA